MFPWEWNEQIYVQMRNKLIWFQFGKKRSISKCDFIRILNVFAWVLYALMLMLTSAYVMVEIQDWRFQQHSNYNQWSIRPWILECICEIYSYSVYDNFDDSIFVDLLLVFVFLFTYVYEMPTVPGFGALKKRVRISLHHPNRDYTYYTWHIIAWICIPNYSNWLSVLYIQYHRVE